MKERERAAANRREIVDARLSRRELARLGLLTSGGMLITKNGLSARREERGAPVRQLQSPPLTPFVDRLPIPPVPQPVSALTPDPTEEPNSNSGEGRRERHQRYAEFRPAKYYQLHEHEAAHRFHRDLPEDTIWGFNGIFPGPTFHSRYGEPITVRIHNDLPANHVGFGIPQTSTHLHNAHTPSESDGFPGNFMDPGQWYDHRYPMVLAGYDAWPPNGDANEALSTLWYHDHRQDFTAQNVYKGLAGFHLLFDHIDSGDETDPSPTALRLPSGEFDVPLIFADKVIGPDGKLFFDLFNLDGIIGDAFTVNGKVRPFFEVARRKYRFRFLNGGPSRFYEFFLSNGQQFTFIGNDGNLVPAPIRVTSFRLGVAERADVIIDFSNARLGDRIVLQNRLEQEDGRGPTKKILRPPGHELLRFDVVRDAPDPSVIPARLRNLPIVDTNTAVTTRVFKFHRSQGAWMVNDRFFDVAQPIATPRKGTAEIWVLRNESGGWQHPVHIHFEEFQILSRNGGLPPATEISRKDVAIAGFNEEIRLFMRFRDFEGKYVLHCHNTVHEDHAMMMRWDVVP